MSPLPCPGGVHGTIQSERSMYDGDAPGDFMAHVGNNICDRGQQPPLSLSKATAC